MQQGDIKLFQEPDGGNISIDQGIAEMSGGLETAVYLSLFGGNEDDACGADVSKSWWGNIGENQASRTYRSEFQYLLKSIPLTTGNLNDLKEAANRDLKWMITEKVASSVNMKLSIPALNTVGVVITIKAEGSEEKFEFTENWKAANGY